MRALIIGAITLILVGCSTQPGAVPWHPEAAMLTLCHPTGPMLEGGTGKDVLVWGVAMRQDYEVCAARHKRLVEAIPK